MPRISHLALAACLIGTGHAFTVGPSSCTQPRSVSALPPTPQSITFVSHRPLAATSALHSTKSPDQSYSGTTSNLKKLPASAIELTLTIPPSATTAVYDKVLSTVSKKVSIPGFRKGAKIPTAVIENAWNPNGGKKNLKAMAVQELASELIGKTLKDEYDLEPIGQPAIVPDVQSLADTFRAGEELQMVVKCDVWPDIEWKKTDENEKPYLGLKGSYKRKPFNQVRFDAAMRDLMERYARLEPFEDSSAPLAMGDACVVNMVGYLAANGERGEALPEGVASGDNVEVVLGKGRYMEGLVEGLVGGKVGETKEVKVRFPDALKNKELAGKDAIFDVTILSASKRILPTLTDEFANQVRPGLTAQSLQDELRKAVDTQDAQEYMGARNEALGVALAEVLEVEVPDTLVTNQAREKYALMMTEMRNNGMADEEIQKLISPENFIKYKDLYAESIVRDFKTSMALDEIARLENIQVPAYQIEEQIQSLKDQAAKEGQSDEVDDEQIRKKVESTLERRMVFDFLAEHAELEVEYMKEGEDEFDEAMMEKLAQESLEREQAESAEGKDDDDAEVVTAAAESVAETETEATGEIESNAAIDDEVSVKKDEVPSYNDLNLEEKAFSILTNLGLVDINPDPDSPDFDASAYAEDEEDE
ncbi:hypothetical protein HJC23_010011 [Cyclotella cryptica]|uniref:peptidylprolyl isomerase n=1 Tax=Cyclotella cryptica TaxID=29204 RepID=A0ABD3QAF3_9STRA|eukprot:CCRYP_007794-RA/>CCRYP_007794-RA protein AED:0.09 eAED:0.09 QI:247/1/1/1/1/1/3/294/648